MAYNNQSPRAEYTASSSQTVFPFMFKIFSDTDVKVYMTLSGETPNDETDILVLNTGYTVAINGDAGGEIILTNGASINDKITIIRSLKIDRTVEYQKNGDLLASTLNADQEYQTYIIADKASEQVRAIRIPNTAINVDTELESPVGNAYIKWNVTADRLENDTTIPDAVTTSSENASAAALSETNAGISETNASAYSIEAQLRAWEAEAEKLTANSYALEAEDVFVKIYTSDGDGTFTATNTTEYSALHYSLKSDASNAVLLTGDQTIDGIKTFSSSPIVPTPTTDMQTSPKKYVDDGLGTKANTIVANDSQVKTALNASGTAPIYACRAWVNFNGTGTVAIRASGNVSSIIDNGTGDYTVNFATAMPDVNYAAIVSTNRTTGMNNGNTLNFSTSSIDIITVNQASSTTSIVDLSNVFISIFR